MTGRRSIGTWAGAIGGWLIAVALLIWGLLMLFTDSPYKWLLVAVYLGLVIREYVIYWRLEAVERIFTPSSLIS